MAPNDDSLAFWYTLASEVCKFIIHYLKLSYRYEIITINMTKMKKNMKRENKLSFSLST